MTPGRDIMGEVGRFVLLLLLLVLSVVERGWVLVIMWGWFVVPALGVQPLRLPIAIGIQVMVSTLIQVARKPDYHDPLEAVVPILGFPLFTLLIGWIIHLFV